MTISREECGRDRRGGNICYILYEGNRERGCKMRGDRKWMRGRRKIIW